MLHCWQRFREAHNDVPVVRGRVVVGFLCGKGVFRINSFDIAIIGAGITGSAIARQLSRWKLSIALIDGAEDVAMGATKANSAIVHAGYDCKPGSLKAELNVKGNMLYTKWTEELDVPLKRVGTLVAAFSNEEAESIKELYERGIKNGVPDMRIVSGEEAREMEPMLSENVVCALYAPTGGITCPYEMTIACAENARANGAVWKLGKPVTDITANEDGFIIILGDEELSASRVINAAGVFADDIGRMIGDDSFTISPRKGEYLLLDRNTKKPKYVLFQRPTRFGKGVVVSPTVDGNSFAGPTALDMEDKRDNSVTAEGIKQIQLLARKSTPAIDFRNVITSFAGVRAQPSTGDFIVRPSDKNPRFIHAAGISSPGLTSAPAIAELVEKLIRQSGVELIPDENYTPYRKHIREFRHMTDAEKEQAIMEDPLYGRVICRCETITEAEIVEAVRRGARTLDAVKRRTRAGMGRCQGGFCSPRVMEIISRETGIPMEELTKFGGGSYLVAGKTRGGEV